MGTSHGVTIHTQYPGILIKHIVQALRQDVEVPAQAPLVALAAAPGDIVRKNLGWGRGALIGCQTLGCMISIATDEISNG